MNGSRVTTPRHYFVGATVLIAVGLVLGLGISAGFGLPRVTRAADAQVASLPASSAALPESPFVGRRPCPRARSWVSSARRCRPSCSSM